MIALPISIIIVIIFLNKKILSTKYQLFNPITICMLIWLFAFICHSLYFSVEDYTLYSYLMISSGLLFLSFGFWISFLFKNNRKSNSINNNIERQHITNYNMKFICIIVVLLLIIEIIRVLLYYNYVIKELAGSFDFFFKNETEVRNRYLYGSPSLLYSILEFVMNINIMVGYIFLGIYVVKKGKFRFAFLLLCIVLELFSAILTMSKLSFIMFIIVLLVTIFSLHSTRKSQKRLFYILTPIVILGIYIFLMIIGNLRNYETIYDDGLRNIVVDKMIIYFCGGIESFGKFVSSNNSPMDFGTHTFVFLVRIFTRLGLYDGKELVMHGQDFIAIGDSQTNVYTMFRAFYLDFSFIGCLLIPFLIGIIIGFLYEKEYKSISMLIVNSWLSATLAMGFFTYLWSYSIYILVIFYGFFVNFLLKKYVYLEATK